MLQPKNLLTKRGTLLSKEPRVDRKVFAIIDFSDFAFGISVVFSDCYLSTVSDSETVFLCPLSSALLTGNPFLPQTSQPPQPQLPSFAAVASAASFSAVGS